MSTALANPAMVRLTPATWLAKVCDFAALQRQKRETAKAAKAADDACRALQTELLKALSGAPSATCGNYVVVRKDTANAVASITLTDGRAIPLADVAAIIVGHERIPGAHIGKVFGGRAGSTSLDVLGG